MAFEFDGLEEFIKKILNDFLHLDHYPNAVPTGASVASVMNSLIRMQILNVDNSPNLEKTFKFSMPLFIFNVFEEAFNKEPSLYKRISKDDDTQILEISFSKLYALTNTRSDNPVKDLHNLLILEIVKGLSLDSLLVFKANGAFKRNHYIVFGCAIDLADRLTRLKDAQAIIINDGKDPVKQKEMIDSKAIEIFHGFLDDELIKSVEKLNITARLAESKIAEPEKTLISPPSFRSVKSVRSLMSTVSAVANMPRLSSFRSIRSKDATKDENALTMEQRENLQSIQDIYNKYMLAVVEFVAKHPAEYLANIHEHGSLDPENMVENLVLSAQNKISQGVTPEKEMSVWEAKVDANLSILVSTENLLLLRKELEAAINTFGDMSQKQKRPGGLS